jgi:tetratricopeptide (TPR) repeat protein
MLSRKLITVAVVLSFTFMALPAAAQKKSQNFTLDEATAFFQAQDWKNAALAFESVTAQDPKNGQAWFQLGNAHHRQKQHEQAIKAFMQADELQFAQGRSRYNIACGYAIESNQDEALEWLTKAVEVGFNQVQMLETDSDLASLRNDTRFKAVLDVADRNARPCEFSDKHREFDFWIGEWDVFNPQGQKVGTNVVQKFINGCVIYENWTGAGGGFGKSLNYYDPAAGKWRQNWVGASGWIVSYEGEVKDGVMHYLGESILINGSKQLARGTYTPSPDGSVRQLLEQSQDGGATWFVTFDGTYVKKGSPADK